MFRSGENLRGVLEDVAGEPRIDHARVFNVVVGENSAGDKKYTEEDAQDCQADDRSEESLLYANAQTIAPEG